MSKIERLLSDMLAAIERIERYAHAGREMFESNELVRGWTEYQLILLGEAR